MAVYSIGDLEKLCGIKAHTIRIWEQRYGIVSPKRTKTNIRYYQDEDLRMLLKIAFLNKNGTKISKIARMSEREISDRVASLSEDFFQPDNQVDALTLSMIEMDEPKFDKIISSNIRKFGFEETMIDVIFPFLAKLEELWIKGSIRPVQENFIVYLLRQKMVAAIDGIGLVKDKKAPKFLLYLPEGENQELSLLFMYYLLKSRNVNVTYIGLNVTLNDLQDAYSITKPGYIYTIINETYSNKPVQKYIDQVRCIFPECQILLSGFQIVMQGVESNEQVKVLRSLDETLEFLKMLEFLENF